MLSATTQPTDAEGLAKPYLKVGRFPGDNYRVVAALDQTRLNKVNQQNIEALGPEPVLGVQATQERLTVWRTFHLEFDSMVGGERPGPLETNVPVTGVVALAGVHAGEAAYDLDWLGSQRGRFEDGSYTYVRSSGTFTGNIVDNVAGDGSGFEVDNCDNLVISAGLAIPGLITFQDDDGATLPHPLAHAVPFCATRLRAAFLEPSGESYSYDETAPFVENMAGPTDAEAALSLIAAAGQVRDLRSSPPFWQATVLTAWQHKTDEDGDPDPFFHWHGTSYELDMMYGEHGAVLGFSPYLHRADNVTAVYREAIRDWEAVLAGQIPPAFAGQFPAPISPEVEEDITVIHELGHVFGIDHDDSMSQPQWPCRLMDAPYPVQQDRTRAIFYGVDLRTIRTSDAVETDEP